MSFEWNLSSDEEDLEEWTRREGFGPSAAASGVEGEASLTTSAAAKNHDNGAATKHSSDMDSAAAAAAAAWNDPIFGRTGGGDDDDDEEESDVEWEDAEVEEGPDAFTTTKEHQSNANAATSGTVEISLRPVTIHMGKSNQQQQKEEDEKKKSKTKKRKPVRRVLKSLPENIQAMLCNLQRTHLMTLTSHACYVSSQCSNMELMVMSHSIIPSDIVTGVTAVPKVVGVAKQPTMAAPTIPELKRFCQWYFDLIHRADYRLQARRAAHVAAGAPRYDAAARRSRRNQQQQQHSANSANDSHVDFTSSTQCSERRMLEYVTFLAFSMRDDPQLNEENMHLQGRRRSQHFTPQDQNHLLISMARSLGWRTRLVQSMDPIKSELDVDHPLLASSHNIFQMLASGDNKTNSKKRRKSASSRNGSARKKRASSAVNNAGTPTLLDDVDDNNDSVASGGVDSSSSSNSNSNDALQWCEVLCRDPKAPSKFRWIMVDAAHQLVNRPDQVEILLTNLAMSSTPPNSDMEAGSVNNKSRSRCRKVAASNKRTTIPYALAVEHVATKGQGEDSDTPLRVRFTDVTPRYAESYAECLKLRGMLGRSNRGKKVLLSEAELAKTWWATTLRNLNGKTEKETGKKKPPPTFKKAAAVGGGSSAGDAIVLLDDDDYSDKSNNKKSSTSNNNDSDDDDLDRKMPAVERNGENEQHQQQESAAASLDDALDRDEHVELQQSAKNESIPTSKAAFRTHPVYVIPSVLGVAEVLDPTAKKRVCGVFKGELVYRRQEVSTALVAKKWLYQGRQVRPEEMSKPIKRVKARKKPVSKNFKALTSYGVGASNDGSEQQREEIIHAASQPLEKNDGMDNLYAHWQTDAWSPVPIGPTDAIPVNEYKNVELALLNPGLVHIDARGVAGVAKKLGIPYAPCLLGFEGHGGNRTPTIRGIVVHEHNEAIMREASAEVTSHSLQQEQDARRRLTLKRWKKLFVGLLTKDRLDREYGRRDEDHDDE